MSKNNSFIIADPTRQLISLQGNWTTHNLARINRQREHLFSTDTGEIVVDAQQLNAFDTSGALILYGMIRQYTKPKLTVSVINLKEEYQELYDLICQRLDNQVPYQTPKAPNILETIGESSWRHLQQAYMLLSFVGEMSLQFYKSLSKIHKIRWKMIFGFLEDTGVNAIPIVGLLSFLLGIVIGYQGGTQLGNYGANIFVVELVALTMLRELSPMMTAVIVAGRTGSAFTAQIGTMKVTEEISAMRTIGMSPMDVLVLPRVIALMISLPLLTVFADIMGIFGGMVMAASMLDVSFYDFLQRMPEAVSLTSFMIGIGKAPVFALIIAVVGCYQGFQVQGSGESVGRQTTVSVVQAIFILILADAIFSIVFSWMGV